MPARKIRIKCRGCSGIQKGRGASFVPYNEVSFRVDEQECFACWQCCKKIRWGSEHCENCSDHDLCAGEFKAKFEEFVDKEVKGV